jgi:integrase
MREATARIHLTKKAIEAIPVPERGRTTVYDATVSELGLRILPSGKRVFFWFRRVNRKPKFELIGYHPACSVEAARGKAQELTGDLEKLRRNDFKGPNPFEQALASTAAEAVAEEWITKVVVSQRQAYETTRLVRKEILPTLKGKLISEISRPDVLRILDTIKDRDAKVVANRTLGILKRFFDWCIERGYIQNNPAIAIKKDKGAEHSRDRVLSDDELADVWNVAEKMSYPDGPYLRLLILTAQRRDEVAGMKWGKDGKDVDFKSGVWTLEAELAKNNRVSDIALAPEALEILESLPRHKKGSYIFTTTEGVKPINGFSQLKKRLDAELLKLRKARGDDALEHWKLHDIRRTVATHAAETGVPVVVLSAILNHSLGPEQGITAVYNRYKYSKERRAALEAWAKHVMKIAKQARTHEARKTA